MPEILLTGFVPFGTVTDNISQHAVETVEPDLPDGWTCRKAVLPVSWGDTWAELEPRITADTRVVVAFGHDENGTVIAPERIGVNVRHQERPDNDGRIPDLRIEADGPAGRWTSLPVDRIVETVRTAGIPCEASAHAGTYLCNYTTYMLARHRDDHRPDLACGFVHLPPGREPGPDRDAVVRAVGLIARTCCEQVAP